MDLDGDLDAFVAIQTGDQDGFFRNEEGTFTDVAAVHTIPGAEVRVYEAGTKRLLGTRLVDTGDGYCSQNVMPVHVR